MNCCRVGKHGVRDVLAFAALMLCVALSACRTSVEKQLPAMSVAVPAEPTPAVSDTRPAHDATSTQTGNETGRVVSVQVNEAGEIYWDGEAVDKQTLSERLAALRQEDAVVWYGGAPDMTMTPSQRSVFELVMKLGLRTVWVQQDRSTDAPSDADGGRPIVVNTKQIREALSLYDRLKGKAPESRRLLPADVVMRFEPDAQQGYVLRRVELGVVGESLWIVHEALSDNESATSIQFKQEW